MYKYLLESLSKALIFFDNKSALSKNQERTKNTMIHIFFSLCLKAINIAVNFLLVPMSIGFIGSEKYGIWLAISSIFTWFSLFDLGFGHGLRNKLTESLANENIKLSKIYVSTTYAIVSVISVVVFLVLLFVNALVDWSSILNVSIEFSNDLSFLFIILLSFFFITTCFKANYYNFICKTKTKYSSFNLFNWKYNLSNTFIYCKRESQWGFNHYLINNGSPFYSYFDFI